MTAQNLNGASNDQTKVVMPSPFPGIVQQKSVLKSSTQPSTNGFANQAGMLL